MNTLTRRAFVASAAVAATVAALPALASGPRHIVLMNGDDLTAAIMGLREGDTLIAQGVTLLMPSAVRSPSIPACTVTIEDCTILCQGGFTLSWFDYGSVVEIRRNHIIGAA